MLHPSTLEVRNLAFPPHTLIITDTSFIKHNTSSFTLGVNVMVVLVGGIRPRGIMQGMTFSTEQCETAPPYHIELSKNVIDKDRLREQDQIKLCFMVGQSSNNDEESEIQYPASPRRDASIPSVRKPRA